jgi:hypothetical protein
MSELLLTEDKPGTVSMEEEAQVVPAAEFDAEVSALAGRVAVAAADAARQAGARRVA